MTRPVRRSSHLAVVAHVDREVVLDLRSLDDQRPLVIEGSALAVWRAIDGVHDRDAIVAAVAAEYRVEVGVVVHDVDALLVELRRRGLLDSG